jgi:hypothetical protein
MRKSVKALPFNIYLVTKTYLLPISIAGISLCVLIPYLFIKNMGIEDWGYSEFLINYSQGFVRRGLTGELALIIAEQTTFSFYTILSLFLLAAHITNIFLLWRIVGLLATYNNRAWLLLAAPGILLFPIWDTNAFIRKDHYLIGLLLFHALIAIKVQAKIMPTSKYFYYLKLILLASFIVTLMHEANYFLLFVHLAMVKNVIKVNGQVDIMRKAIQLIIVAFISQTILFVYLFIYRISLEATEEMFIQIPASLMARKDPVLAVSNSFSENSKLTHLILQSPVSMLSYFIAFLIGPVLVIWILKVRIKKANVLLLTSVLPQLSLFIIGWDWGRWLWFLTASVLALFVSDINSYNASIKPIRNRVLQNIFLCVPLLLFHIPHSGNIRFENLSNIPIFLKFAREAVDIIKG